MAQKALGGIIIGVILYIGTAFGFSTFITGTSSSEMAVKTFVPIGVACMVVAITVIGAFRHP